jgi:hypothetical protein
MLGLGKSWALGRDQRDLGPSEGWSLVNIYPTTLHVVLSSFHDAVKICP